MMDDITINNLLLKHERLPYFHGVFGKDAIENIHTHSLPCSFIFNEDNFAGKGTHWVAVYIDDNHALDFYDSFGEPPALKEFKSFIRPFKLSYNKTQVQSFESGTCGQHCIFFLINRTKNVTMNSLVSKYFNMYDKLSNDLYVYNYVNRRYGLK